MKKVVKDYDDVATYDLASLFCDDKFCSISKDGKLLYRDDNHLTLDGSLYVADALLEFIKE